MQLYMQKQQQQQQPKGQRPPQQTSGGKPLTCADILKNNVRDALIRDFEQHAAEWNLDVPWDQPQTVVGGNFKSMWQTVTLNVRFDLSFVPKKDLDHAAASIEDYDPVFKITGSKQPRVVSAKPNSMPM